MENRDKGYNLVILTFGTGMMALVIGMGWIGTHSRSVTETVTATGYVEGVVAGTDKEPTIITLTSAGPTWKPIAFRGMISTPQVRDYTITNQLATLPAKGERITLNLTCDRVEPDISLYADGSCVLESWGTDSQNMIAIR